MAACISFWRRLVGVSERMRLYLFLESVITFIFLKRLVTASRISFCSSVGGKGKKVCVIFSLEILGCAPPSPFFMKRFRCDNK